MSAPSPSRRAILLGAILAAVLCAVALLATSPGLPMAWDEGNAILRAEQIPQGQWPYTTRHEGHPALYGMVIALGKWFSGGWLSPLGAARFGPIMLFSLAAGAMFYRTAREYSIAAAAGAVAALLLLPRMFAHAHFASFDGPLTSCWILAWAAFAPAQKRTAAVVLWGVALGMTLSCKATGWFAPLPFLAWAAVYRDRAAAKALAVAMPVAALTFFLLNPPLWHQPIHGTAVFFARNFNRAANPGLNISTWFLGRMYNLDHSLPWYNTIFWTAVVVPVGTLFLAGTGVVAAVRRYRVERFGVLILFNWLVLLIVRALPGVPPHDGIRLFLPSFAFLAVLAGIGCGQALSWARGSRSRWIARAGVGLLYAGSAVGMVVYAPQWLSSYNLLIGGLPGATALGMEPTYYWDALDRSALDWLADDENTAQDEMICFGAGSPENLRLMARERWGTLRRPWGILDREASPTPPGPYRWYIIQHRPSACRPPDLWLIENVEPAYRKTLLGVPLLSVYEYQQYVQACGEARRVVTSEGLPGVSSTSCWPDPP